jgi:DNA-binding PadR family transcriptional regulator
LKADVSKKHDIPPRDRRSKLDLELFVLALVLRDVNTPYAMLATAGLSPGATLPVLNRLEKAGLVRKGKPGARGRMEFEVTASGRQQLKVGWRPLLESPAQGDIESILRIVALSVLSQADKKMVLDFLESARTSKVKNALRRTSEAKAAKDPLSDESDTGLYAWMQATHAAARLASEAKVLRQLASAIKRRTRKSATTA